MDAQRGAVAHERERAIAVGLGGAKLLGQRIIIVESAFRQCGHDVEAADGLELEIKIVQQIDDELLRLAARAFGHRARLLRFQLGFLRALHVEEAEGGARKRTHREHRANRGDLSCTHERLPCRALARALLVELAFGLVARFALVAQVAAGSDHAAQYVVRQLYPAHIEPLLDAQQSPVDERGERIGSRTRRGKRLPNALLRNAFAKAGVGQQFVFDVAADRLRLVGERALVEVGQDRIVRSREEVNRDFGATLRDTGVVELAADEAQKRRLDFGIPQLGAARDETHDRLGDFERDELAARLHHGGERLLARHAGEPHPVLRDRRHHVLQRLEMRQVILAQRNQDPVIAAREIESFGGGFVLLYSRFERLGRAVLDEIGQVLDELRGALAPEIVGLRKRENFLELVEDQQRDERLAGRVAQDVVAMMQELP